MELEITLESSEGTILKSVYNPDFGDYLFTPSYPVQMIFTGLLIKRIKPKEGAEVKSNEHK